MRPPRLLPPEPSALLHKPPRRAVISSGWPGPKPWGPGGPRGTKTWTIGEPQCLLILGCIPPCGRAWPGLSFLLAQLGSGGSWFTERSILNTENGAAGLLLVVRWPELPGLPSMLVLGVIKHRTSRPLLCADDERAVIEETWRAVPAHWGLFPTGLPADRGDPGHCAHWLAVASMFLCLGPDFGVRGQNMTEEPAPPVTLDA